MLDFKIRKISATLWNVVVSQNGVDMDLGVLDQSEKDELIYDLSVAITDLVSGQ